MPSIGALDLGYGSGLQIVRTNYLITTEGALTAASTNLEQDGAKNLLSLVQKHFGEATDTDYKNLRPDYIVIGHSKVGTAAVAATIAGTGATATTGTATKGVIAPQTVRIRSATVVSGASGYTNGSGRAVTVTGGGATTQATFGDVTVSGGAAPTGALTLVTPGAGYTSIPTIAVATGTNMTYTIDTILEVTAPVAGYSNATSDANPDVLAVLGVGGVELTTNGFTDMTDFEFTFANVVLDTPAKAGTAGAAAGSVASTLMSNVMTSSGKGYTSQLDITDAIDPIEVALGHALDLSQANLNASFVEQGNTDGTTATELSDVLTASQNQLGILSVVTLCRGA